METFLMNPHTGTVQTEEEWREDYLDCTTEEWGGDNFEDAELIEVVRNVPGEPGYDADAGEWREAS